MTKYKRYWLLILVLLFWELSLIFKGAYWSNLILLPAGAIAGCLILELKWFSFSKETKKMLPILLLPLTIFIITSTAEIFGKSIIVFLNLQLILDNYLINKDNKSQPK